MLNSKIFPATILFCLGLATLYVWAGCNKDSTSQQDKNLYSQLNCVVSISFEMETTTSARVVNASDLQELSQIDRIMALPHRERFAVQACYKADNDKQFTMTVLSPENPIVYPNNAADGYIKPDYHKLEVINGVARYYDQSNNIIRTASHEGDVVAVQKILQMVASRKPLTTTEFTQGINMMRDSGMLVQHHENNLVSIRLNNPDGSHCVQVIDKVRQTAVGNFYYESNGEMQSRSMLNFDGTAQQPVLKHAFTESKYLSMEKNIPMWIQQYSSFDNFTITFQ
jgi:hypothetical protein